MIRIFLLSLFFMLPPCASSARKAAMYAAIPPQKSRRPGVSCEEKLRQLVLSCTNFKTPFDRKSMHAEVEEERENGVYVIRLFAYSDGENSTSTQGWIVLDTEKRLLKDITYDPDAPVILNYDKEKYKDYVVVCLGKAPTAKPEGLETLDERLPLIHFPFEYSYDFIIDLPGTVAPSKALVPLLKTFVDTETDLSNCHIARLPSLDGYELLLICGTDRVGEGRFFLCSLDKTHKLTDRLLVYTAKNVYWKGQTANCYLHYTIGHQGILLKKMIAMPNKNIPVDSKNYAFSKGKFRLVK